MSRYQQLQKFFEKGGSATDAELAMRFAKQHEPKRGAEIIRSTICTLIKKDVNICKQTVDGQRKQQYYIPFAVPVQAKSFAKPVKAKAPAIVQVRVTYDNGVTQDYHPRY